MTRGCCPPKPALRDRPLLAAAPAAELAAMFKILAGDTRLRLLHAMVREREIGVTDLARRLDMKPQAVSNQLRLLAARGVVAGRRDGTNVLYRIEDPCVAALLDKGLCLSEDARRRRR